MVDHMVYLGKGFRTTNSMLCTGYRYGGQRFSRCDDTKQITCPGASLCCTIWNLQGESKHATDIAGGPRRPLPRGGGGIGPADRGPCPPNSHSML